MTHGEAVATQTVPGMAEAVQARMDERGLSPGDFARLADVTPQGLAHVRQGRRKRYQSKIKFGVARALQWPPDWYERLEAGEDPDTWADVAHPGRPASTDDRVTMLEREVVELRSAMSGVAAQLQELQALVRELGTRGGAL